MKSYKSLVFSLQVTLIIFSSTGLAQKMRARDLGLKIGVLDPGTFNSITDVAGVKVGHYTLFKGEAIRTGVTAILPYDGNVFKEKVPAAIHIGNGFGKLMGISQVEELGNIETPILLTNTLNVPKVADALIDYVLQMPGNEEVRSVNAVVGETNDGYLNDIQGRHIGKEEVFSAIQNAKGGPVEEGTVGAGTGTVCFGFKGGIGTSSRKLPEEIGGYTVGVLVQSNFGGVLQVAGVPMGEEMGKYYLKDKLQDSTDGSCMIVVATDAPLSPRNLKRLAKRAMLGLAKTGGIVSNGSGDYVISFSTARENRVPYAPLEKIQHTKELRNDFMSPLFMAAIEATEEAILNSLFMAESVKGKSGRQINAIDIDEVRKILKRYGRL